jgi:MFS family permease
MSLKLSRQSTPRSGRHHRVSVSASPTTSPISHAVRVFLLFAAALVFASAVSLFFLSEQTDRYFAWTINPPLTAAFLGAGYGAITLVLLIALLEREWTNIRLGVSVLATGLVLILLATLLHLDRFHLNSPIFTAQLWAWAWLILYVILVPGLVFVLWLQRREKRQLRPRQSSLAPWLRILMGLLGTLMAVIGVGLILLPTTFAGFWPWPLTPLTGRMIGAWFTAIAVSLLAGTLDNDYPRLYIGAVAYIAFAILQFVNLVRYPTSADWSRPNTWLLIVTLASLLVIGVASLRGYFTFRREQLT